MSKIVALFFMSLFFLASATKADPTVFTVDNSSSQNLGIVTLHGTSSSASLSVYANTLYAPNLSFVVTAVTINGNTIYGPNPGVVTLPNGSKVQVTWSTNSVEIGDWLTGSRPGLGE